MAHKSNFLENAILNYVYRGVAMPALTSLYCALYTTLPDEAGAGGVEVTGGSYARQAIARNTSEWKDPSTATQGMTENTNAITFPTASAGWGTVLGAGLLDASSGGNLLVFNTLAVSKVVNIGDVFKFNAGDFEHSED